MDTSKNKFFDSHQKSQISGINEIINSTKHSLHLCDNTNFKEIIFTYLLDYDVLVTKDTEFWKEEFSKNKINAKIKNSNSKLGKEEKVVVDGSSLKDNFSKYEKNLERQLQVVCVYNLNKLDSSIIKELVACHDKMILSVNNIRMLSNKDFNVEKRLEGLDPEIVEKLVKKELKNILLGVLLKEPMSGTELVKTVYTKFRVFVSPGMIYPALHELKKEGLLKYEYKLKNKIYSIAQEEQAKILLDKHTEINSLIFQSL